MEYWEIVQCPSLEVIVIKIGGEVDWDSFFGSFLEKKFEVIVIIGRYVGIVRNLGFRIYLRVFGRRGREV